MDMGDIATSLEQFNSMEHDKTYCTIAICTNPSHGELITYFMNQNEMHNMVDHIVTSYVFVNGWNVLFHNIEHI